MNSCPVGVYCPQKKNIFSNRTLLGRKLFDYEDTEYWFIDPETLYTCYCYGNLSEDQEQQDYLDVLSFPQKVGLWLQFLENRFDYEEFAWLYDRISAQELNDRIEWELAVYAALNQLEYALKISKSEFELYDGSGERRYFSFNSEQNAQRVFLKLLFPLNV